MPDAVPTDGRVDAVVALELARHRARTLRVHGRFASRRPAGWTRQDRCCRQPSTGRCSSSRLPHGRARRAHRLANAASAPAAGHSVLQRLNRSLTRRPPNQFDCRQGRCTALTPPSGITPSQLAPAAACPLLSRQIPFHRDHRGRRSPSMRLRRGPAIRQPEATSKERCWLWRESRRLSHS